MSAAAQSSTRKTRRRWAPHLLASGDITHTCRILRRFGREIDRPYLLRAAAIPVVSMLHTPFAAGEWLLTNRRIQRQQLADPLVMIIGHWRSGTTNLHNYLLQDPRFGCVSLLHCLAPHEFLTLRRLARRLLRHLIFSRRPMDRMKTGLEEPMSEDFALVGVTDQTHYLGYFFPRQLEQTFRDTVLFDGVSPEHIDRWAADLRAVAEEGDNGVPGTPAGTEESGEHRPHPTTRATVSADAVRVCVPESLRRARLHRPADGAVLGQLVIAAL